VYFRCCKAARAVCSYYFSSHELIAQGHLCEATLQLDKFVKYALKAAPRGCHVDEFLPVTTAAERQCESRVRSATGRDNDEENGGEGAEGGEASVSAAPSASGAVADGPDGGSEAAGASTSSGGGPLSKMIGLANPLTLVRNAVLGAASNVKWAGFEIDVDPSHAAWLKLTKTGDPREPSMAELLVSIELIPQQLARDKAAGAGQSSPNAFPELPPPADRGKCSLSFSGFMRWLFSNKIALCCCCCVLLVLIVVLVVLFMPVYNLMKESMNSDLPPKVSVDLRWAMLVVFLLLICVPPCGCYIHYVGCCGYCGRGRVQRKRVFIRDFSATPIAELFPSAQQLRSLPLPLPSSTRNLAYQAPQTVAPGTATHVASSGKISSAKSSRRHNTDLKEPLLSADDRDSG
jgi:hypothetical protein